MKKTSSSILKEVSANAFTSIFIIAKPGRRRDSLRAMLKTITGLKIAGQADDGPTTLKMMVDCRPKLVLLDSNLPDDKAWTVLTLIKSKWPQIPCLVLVDTLDQQQTAKIAGADDVLITEFSITKLDTTINELLS